MQTQKKPNAPTLTILYMLVALPVAIIIYMLIEVGILNYSDMLGCLILILQVSLCFFYVFLEKILYCVNHLFDSFYNDNINK